MRTKWFLLGWGVALAYGGAAFAQEPVLTRLGVVRAVAEPATATDLAVPGWVRSTSEPRSIELDNGRQLWLEAQTNVYFSPAPGGAVDVVVASGNVWVRGQHGERFTAGTNSAFRLTPADGYPARVVLRADEPASEIESSDHRRRSRARG